jgi:dTDP-4-amino-4,6-dideoxygalactose transaminase
MSPWFRQSDSPAPLANASLGADDVELARAWLRRRGEWRSEDQVELFETAFARWNGTRHAVAFMGARVALSAALDALGLRPGDEVILPGYTCVVVANALRYAGVVPVYVDIELETYGLDGAQVEARIGPGTRAVLLHHLFGLAARDYELVVRIARRHGLAVIEDCAQSAGVEWRGGRIGNLGDIAMFSTEQSKHLNTIQGGLALTNNDDLAQRLRGWQHSAPHPDVARVEALLRTVVLAHARTAERRTWSSRLTIMRNRYAQMASTTPQEERGERPDHYGQRMPAAIAAIGLNQLAKADSLNAERRTRARYWEEWCRNHGYDPPLIVEGSVPTFLRYPVLVEPARKQDRSWAHELGVDVGVWFKGKLHPVDVPIEGCPRADEAVARCINFPCLWPQNGLET